MLRRAVSGLGMDDLVVLVVSNVDEEDEEPKLGGCGLSNLLTESVLLSAWRLKERMGGGVGASFEVDVGASVRGDEGGGSPSGLRCL